MTAQRTSNKQIADKLDTLIDLLTAQAIAPAPVAIATAIEDPAIEAKAPEVDPAYLAHMNLKAAQHATKQSAEVVLYSRRNKSGQVKLAYALRSRYDDVVAKQPSCLGPLGTYQP